MSEILLPSVDTTEPIVAPVVPDAFAEYRTALLPVSEVSPQFQGYTEEEFARAIGHPAVMSTDVISVEGLHAELPQLSPISQFEWLNADFYERTFPEDTKQGTIAHYTHYEGVTPGAEVVEGLRGLAANNGVVVFDHPNGAEGYEGDVRTMLAEQGIEVEEETLLGTQTYYLGKTRLKAGVRPNEPIKEFNAAFREMTERGLIPNLPTGSRYESEIDPELAFRMYGLYDAAFEKNNDHPCRQGLTPEEFLEVMTEKPDIAKLVHDVDGEPSTVCILGNDLEEFPWVNPDRLKEKYPAEYDGKQIVYFPGLATDPEKQGELNTRHIVNLIAQMSAYANNEIVVGFDCCDRNKGFLDVFLTEFINATPQSTVEFEEIGEQRYVAYRLKLTETED